MKTPNKLVGMNALDGQINLVTFRIEREIFALPIEPIRQIIEMVTITPLPQVTESLEGTINFHGSTVPVINLRRLMGLPQMARGLHTPIILATISNRLMGVIVDEVLEVVSQLEADIVAPQQILPEELGDIAVLRGLIQQKDQTILLLDLTQLLVSNQTQRLVGVGAALSALESVG